MQIHIEGSRLPGRACGPGGDFAGYENIHVGVQRKDRPGELLGLFPGDAASASWTLDCTATAVAASATVSAVGADSADGAGGAGGAGGVEISGPYVQDRLGGRFVYLSWGTVDENGLFSMFRRAKLMFADIGADVLEAAARSGHLTARLPLSDATGRPLCARVRPPVVEWSAAAPS
ncbi:DUF5990 family protein [Streptomyces sp. NPDC059814]|uniref:DUF5990 family protein n=1 Tax=Streptomyces sp. NPDC059814 TaxID=3346959 RepID=UPI00364B1546